MYLVKEKSPYRTMISAALLLLLLVSCSKQPNPAESKSQAGPKTFASPDDAAKAVVDAAASDNNDAMLAIFGPQSKDAIDSGDAAQDKAAFAAFVSDYGVMHRWRNLPDGGELLITGSDNKVFSIPLKKNASGQWYFDTAAGEKELVARRIGRDELAAIDICAAIADAQHQYFGLRQDGVNQYAEKFISDPDKHNGLYWPQVDDQTKSPLGPLVAFATGEGYKVQPSQHRPYFGYYFVMLDKQGSDAKGGTKDYIVNGKMTGGFAVLAYPSQYRESGIMSFIINQNGVVYEKDLGTTTNDLAAAMTEFNPDKSWKPVEE